MRKFLIYVTAIGLLAVLSTWLIIQRDKQDERLEVIYTVPQDNICNEIEPTNLIPGTVHHLEPSGGVAHEPSGSEKHGTFSCELNFESESPEFEVRIFVHAKVDDSSSMGISCTSRMPDYEDSEAWRYSPVPQGMDQEYLSSIGDEYSELNWIRANAWYGFTFGLTEGSFDIDEINISSDPKVDASMMSCHNNLFVEVGYYLDAANEEYEIATDELMELLGDIRNELHTHLVEESL